MTSATLRPAPDPLRPGRVLRVLYPGERLARSLPASGATVQLSTYWRRRLASGEVLVVTDATPGSAPAAGEVSP